MTTRPKLIKSSLINYLKSLPDDVDLALVPGNSAFISGAEGSVLVTSPRELEKALGSQLDAKLAFADNGSIRERVASFIKKRGAMGATSDEIEHEMKLPHQTCSARVHELEKEGRIIDCGSRRKTRSGRKAKVFMEMATYLESSDPFPT